MAYREIDKCRICGNTNLVSILRLGDHYLSGVFPNTRAHLDTLTSGPLDLVKCHDDEIWYRVCGLLQLRQSYDLREMYGDNYGYRSGLNRTMVNHLNEKVRKIIRFVDLKEGDLVIDVGSNDATLLKAYPKIGIEFVGFDPAGNKFREYYPPHIHLITNFFSAKKLRYWVGDHKAKVITSIAMFYDLEDPMGFMREVHDVLADDGIWVLEQSYMPAMLKKRSYDMICHEHLEYYGLAQISWMAGRAGFRVIGVEFNEINGGSFEVILAKDTSAYLTAGILMREPDSLEPYFAFAEAVAQSRRDLLLFLTQARDAGKRVYGIGASTKGNTILQYCGITEDLLPAIGEVNSDKFGCFTPGSRIPILPEDKVLAMKPDYLLVLPWHFREFFERDPKYREFNLVFPLPNLEIRVAHK